MSDTGQDIEIPDSMTLKALQALVNDTEHRVCILTMEPARAEVQWRNYYKKAGKRVKDKNRAYKLDPLQRKWVKIT
jgi:hypothetical protein